MSLNLHIREANAVLRVHGPRESRVRIEGLRSLRRLLHDAGLTVGAPLPLDGREVVAWQGRWAELESFVDHVTPRATWESYTWMFASMGRLHRALTHAQHVRLPRPAIATYGQPTSLRRWLAVTRDAVRGDPAAEALALRCADILRRLAPQWPAPGSLPTQLVHGDIRLGNVALTSDGEAAFFDFGFAASRPRIHELAYSLSWMILRPDGSGRAEDFAWDRLGDLIEAYEGQAGITLSSAERKSLGPFTAAVPLYLAAIAGFTAHPAANLLGNEPFIDIAEWIVAERPTAAPSSAVNERRRG